MGTTLRLRLASSAYEPRERGERADAERREGRDGEGRRQRKGHGGPELRRREKLAAGPKCRLDG